MNIHIFAGAILIAIGTLWIAYGNYSKTQEDNVKSTQESHEQFEKLWQGIISLKQQAQISPNALEKLENEFETWAKAFVQDKDLQRLKFRKMDLEAEQTQLEYTINWKYIFDYFFQVLSGTLTSYREVGFPSLAFDIPSLPQNLFSQETKNYWAKVSFPNSTVWKIGINTPTTEGLPNVTIIIGTETSNSGLFKPEDQVFIFIDPNRSELRLEKGAIFAQALGKLASETAVQNYQSTINDIVRTMIEYQLSRTN